MRRNNRHQQFWNKEYKAPAHLALSTAPAEDLEKFTRWLRRNFGGRILHQNIRVLDLGSGNGRNLIYLARTFGVHGRGIDISAEAINQAKRAAGDLPLDFVVGSIADGLNQEPESFDLVLDLMTSHVLNAEQRKKFFTEVWQVLKPGGWLLFKTFLLEEDLHAKRLLREHPAGEANSYLHPELGVLEHVWTIDEIYQFFADKFEVQKVEKSHKHLKGRDRSGRGGQAFRRRTVTVYLEKKL